MARTGPDLSAERLIDNHCHRPLAGHGRLDGPGWARLLSESDDDSLRSCEVRQTAHYRRLLRRLAGFLCCAADEESVVAARQAAGTDELTRSLFTDAGVARFLFDEGFPREGGMEAQRLSRLGPFAVSSILRLETLAEQLLPQAASLDELEQALDAELADVRASGFVGLKTVIAYRTGLLLDQWSRDEMRHAFRVAREAAARDGRCRLSAKPLTDSLLRRALLRAAKQELPVQVHTGYGDADVDLRLANPLHTRPWLTDPALAGMKLVLLHGCYPYTREGAYLASVYGHAYLDVSFAIPHASTQELVQVTRQALGIAPASRVLYSSDAYCIPELHWLSAHDGRRCLSQVLGELIQHGDLDPDEAMRDARRVLSGNAARLYQVTP